MAMSVSVEKFEYYVLEDRHIMSEIRFRRSLLQREGDRWFFTNVFTGPQYDWFFVQKQLNQHISHIR
jgi:hypothetical protein